jgi:metal-responsive CopG/Arc/MetJ family transcriptional regulator
MEYSIMEHKTTPISFSLDDKSLEQIDSLAKNNRISRSSALRIIIAAAFADGKTQELQQAI